MDSIWGVKLPKKLPLWKRLRQTVLPFVLVSALGLIVIAWTALASGLFNVIAVYSSGTLSGFVLLGAAQAASTFVVATLLLAIIYKMIPQVKVHWHDVRLAAVATGLAFTVTNYVFGAYIQVFVVTTVAGAAGALLIILLWIFVLNQIVLFGAELSRAVATTVGAYAGQRVLPEPVERLVDPLQRAGELFEWVTKGEIEYVEPQKNVQNSEEKPEKTGKTEN
jgi:membrane protein